MIILKNEEMTKVTGGSTITASLLSAINKTVQIIFDLGQSIGNSLRRIINGEKCPIQKTNTPNVT